LANAQQKVLRHGGLTEVQLAAYRYSTVYPADGTLLGFIFKFEHLYFNLSSVPGLTLIITATNAKPERCMQF